MTSLSDTLTVGLVLVLLFGSIALYLYTRIQQAEQKISLLESILLDLKMSAEIKSYSELPADNEPVNSIPLGQQSIRNYVPFTGEDEHTDDENLGDYGTSKSRSPAPSASGSVDESTENDVSQYKSVIADAVKSDNDHKDIVEVSVNYESMTLKELQTLAKTRGITGNMKKGAIIEALKTSDRSSSAPQPGSSSAGSFLETSSSFQVSSDDIDSE